MKKIVVPIIILAVTALIISSCNQPSGKSNGSATDSTVVQPGEQPALTTDSAHQQNEKAPVQVAITSFSVAPIVNNYLSLKNALVADNDKAAAGAGKQLLATLQAVDMKTIPADKHKAYMDIADDAKENASHIGDNTGNISHQREHLVSLSKDISDLVALFGTSQKLYEDHCPMYNNGKGATWLSETKAIKNPYYGSEMLTCGSVKKEY